MPSDIEMNVHNVGTIGSPIYIASRLVNCLISSANQDEITEKFQINSARYTDLKMDIVVTKQSSNEVVMKRSPVIMGKHLKGTQIEELYMFELNLESGKIYKIISN